MPCSSSGELDGLRVGSIIAAGGHSYSMAETISKEKKPTKDSNTPISQGLSALVVGICQALHQIQLFSSLGYAALCRQSCQRQYAQRSGF